MPMNLRLHRMAATPVAPDHMQLSSTVSPSLVYVRIRYSIRDAGFCVGWVMREPPTELSKKSGSYRTLKIDRGNPVLVGLLVLDQVVIPR